MRCTIIDEAAQAAGPTTICDDGSSTALEGTVTLVVDEDGQTTPAPGIEFTEAALKLDFC